MRSWVFDCYLDDERVEGCLFSYHEHINQCHAQTRNWVCQLHKSQTPIYAHYDYKPRKQATFHFQLLLLVKLHNALLKDITVLNV